VCSLRLLPLLFSLLAAAVVRGMWSVSLRHLAVAAGRSRGCVSLLRAFFMQVAAPTAHAAGGCLQLAQTRPNIWQLKHRVRVDWDLSFHHRDSVLPSLNVYRFQKPSYLYQS
jgi:hypothetical protein